MKILKNNESLSLSVIERLCEEPTLTLYVNPALRRTAEEVLRVFMKKFSFKENGELLDLFEAIQKRYINVKIEILPISYRSKDEELEWLLITDKEMFYSQGTNNKSNVKDILIEI